MKFSELYRKLERAGWYRDQGRGARHRIYVHHKRPGIVIPEGTILRRKFPRNFKNDFKTGRA